MDNSPRDKDATIASAAARYEALVDCEHVWTARDIGANAIAGILTDPATKAAARALRGMDALPLVPPTLMRKVKPSEFDAYTKALEPVLDRYMINQTLGPAAIEGAPMLGSLEQQLESGSFIDLVMATERILVDNTKSKNKPDRSTHRRLLAAHAPPLDTVPDLFFTKDFKLGNPTLFAQVYEKADFSKLSLQDVNLTSSLLQDKLGVFCDTVDVYLVKEISKRSASFFSALSTLQALHLETESCISQIHQLRSRMKTLTQTTITPGLNVARLHTRRCNVQKLHECVEKIFKVQSDQETIDALVREKEFVEALHLIDECLQELKVVSGGVDLEASADAFVNNTGSESATPGIIEGRLSHSLTVEAKASSLEEPVHLVKHLHLQLTKQSISIAAQMETEFIDILLSQIREIANLIDPSTLVAPVLENTPTGQWVKNIVKKKQGENIFTVSTSRASEASIADDPMVARLMPLVFGLISVNKFGLAIQQYKESLIKEIKNLSRKKYPVPPAEIGGPVGSPIVGSPMSPTSPTSKKELQNILAKQLKQMSFDSFLDLLITIYSLVLHIFDKSSSIHLFTTIVIRKAEQQGIHIGTPISPVTSTDRLAKKKKHDDEDDDFGSTTDLFSLDPTTDAMMQEKKKEQEQQLIDATGFTQLISESNELLLAISEAANARCAKLLAVRSDQNAKLSPKDFYRLLGATKEFISASEFLCGYHCINLKGALLSQAKQFLNHFHEERTRQIVIVIENEQWTRAEVPIDFQKMSEEISAAGALAIEKKKSTRLEEEEDLDDTDLAALVIAHKEAAAAASEDELVTSGRALKVDGYTYCVAGCVLLVTKMLTEYLQCVENIPSLSTDILNRTLDLLKVFNSRICQVILGAGATKSAGLKNINAGHIALTSQSLGAVIGYIPHLKVAIEHHVPAKQNALLEDFDKILKDYKDHQSALYEKLVSIMQERMSYHAKNMLNVNWDSPDSKDMTGDQACSVHVAGLLKETTTMHRVLMKFLPKDTLKSVMCQIFKAYNKGLEEELKKVDVFTSAGKNRLLMDGQHLIAELSALDNIDGPGNSIEVAINNIKIKEKNAIPAVPPGSISSNTATSASPGTAKGAPTNLPATPTAAKGKNLFSKWKE